MAAVKYFLENQTTMPDHIGSGWDVVVNLSSTMTPQGSWQRS